MLCKKKHNNSAHVIEVEDDDTDGDDEEEEKELRIDFAWICFMGMKFGYTEKEVSFMRYGKWCEMFDQFRKMHNMEIKQMIFKEPKKATSVLDL